MANTREPILQPIPILSLHPTQMTVGMREVKEKRKRLREHWRKHKKIKQGEFLGRHMIPVVLGPDQRHYVVDHHHLARALHDEGVEDIIVTVIADLTMVDRDALWSVLDNRRWAYPYDAKGQRQHFRDIPKTVADLKDDPFRSLAGELRRVGGFAKDTTPFSEFLWADFLRRRLSRKSVEADFDKAMEKALALAKGSRLLFRIVASAERAMEPAFDMAAEDQKRERDRKRDRDNPPLPDTASDPNAGREPGTGRAGESVNPKMILRVDNDARAEKADAGEDALNDAAAGVGNFHMIGGWIGQHHDHCRGQTYQTKRLQADRFVLKIAIKPDQAARKRGDAKAQQDLRPIQQCDDLQLRGPQR